MSNTSHSADPSVAASRDVEVILNGETYAEPRILAWREWARVAMMLDQLLANSVKGAPNVYSVQFKNTTDNPGVLLIARATDRGKPVVTFHRGKTAADALRSFVARLEAGSVAWRDDQPFQAGSNGRDDPQGGLPPCQL